VPLVVRVAIAVVVGTVVAFVLVGVIEAIGEIVYPPPMGVDLGSPEQLATYMQRLPVGALAFVLAAWIVATFLGGLVAAWIARSRPALAAAIVGALVLAAAIVNFMLVPHPAWMVAAGVAGIAIAAYLAGRLMRIAT
jgi:hypothetical protein